MRKDAGFYFRIESSLLKVLKEYCKEYKITISGFLAVVIQEVLVNKKISERLSRKLQRFTIKNERKELCNQIYIKKNMYSRVMDVAVTDQFMSGSVNMQSVNAIIDTFIAEFETFDYALKKKIGVDFKITAKQLRNRDYLLSQANNYKMIKYLGKK